MTRAGLLLWNVNQREHRMMRRLNRWHAPRWIRLWMICATRGGDGWLWYAMGLAIVLFGGPERYDALVASSLSAFTGIPLYLFLKKVCGRRRPCHLEPHAWATLLPPDQFSFPSGHTMTAFAVCVPLSLIYPSLMPGLLFCALSIGLSRILLGMHFLSDVLVGGILGALLGAAAYSIVF